MKYYKIRLYFLVGESPFGYSVGSLTGLDSRVEEPTSNYYDIPG